jgi:DNA transformation protein and related proteins
MPVSDGFREFVLEQLRRAASIAERRMFGAVGLYSGGVFFAIIDDDVLYLKADETNRGDFLERGMGPFRPFGDERASMAYYEVPAEVLEDVEELRGWVAKSVRAANRSKRPGPRRPGGKGGAGKSPRRRS